MMHAVVLQVVDISADVAGVAAKELTDAQLAREQTHQQQQNQAQQEQFCAKIIELISGLRGAAEAQVAVTADLSRQQSELSLRNNPKVHLANKWKIKPKENIKEKLLRELWTPCNTPTSLQ